MKQYSLENSGDELLTTNYDPLLLTLQKFFAFDPPR